MKKRTIMAALLATITFALAGCDVNVNIDNVNISNVDIDINTPGTTTTDSIPSTTTTDLIPSTTASDPTTTTTSNPDDDEENYRDVYICEGSSNNKLATYKVKLGEKLLSNISIPSKEGYKFVQFRLSSTSGQTLTEDYVVKKTVYLFAEFAKIDYTSIHYNEAEAQSSLVGAEYYNTASATQKEGFKANGYVQDKMPDFSEYLNTDAYATVSTADQFINALENARNDYTSEPDEILGEIGKKIRDNVRKNSSNWTAAITKGLYLKNPDGTYTKIPSDVPYDPNDTVYTADLTYYEDADGDVEVSIKQTMNKAQTIHVIEITNDIDLGYYNLSSTAKASSIVESYCSKYDTQIEDGTAPFSVTSMLKENGISLINISRSNNLLIYSKNGAKITHAGFKVQSCDRVAFRNLEMDEIWQWEDSPSSTPSFTVGDMDVFGWAYFKITNSGYIWIDHCTFGKSYDGQIDVSNPYFYSAANASKAPYGKAGTYTESNSGGVHISNCKFTSGSDDKDGYLYKMMQEIEADYQKSLKDATYSCKYLYYKILRDKYKLTFDEILYGIAIPQKKAFLLGDSGESKKKESYHFNTHLKVSFANNIMIDIEDRIPNVRGGIAYLYNCLVDNSRYYLYRSILLSKGAGNIAADFPRPNKPNNPYYKLALVSQGIVGGYGAAIVAENCKFMGISTLVKNNNKDMETISLDQLHATYKLINCIWYNDVESSDATRIINTDNNPDQIKSTVGESTGKITTTNFSWHNDANKKPFEPALYDVDKLVENLYKSHHVGTNPNYDSLYLMIL